jgi:hypothetical protein
MSAHLSFEGIEDRSAQIGGVMRRTQVITCSCAGCQGAMEVTVASRRKPPEIIHKIAKRRGWEINPRKAQFLCPEHSK